MFNSGSVDVKEECSWWDVARLFGSHRLEFEIAAVGMVGASCHSESHCENFKILVLMLLFCGVLVFTITFSFLAP